MLGYLLASLLVCLLAYRYLLACAVTGAGTGKPMRQFREELTFIPVTPRYGLVRAPPCLLGDVNDVGVLTSHYSSTHNVSAQHSRALLT